MIYCLEMKPFRQLLTETFLPALFLSIRLDLSSEKGVNNTVHFPLLWGVGDTLVEKFNKLWGCLAYQSGCTKVVKFSDIFLFLFSKFTQYG